MKKQEIFKKRLIEEGEEEILRDFKWRKSGELFWEGEVKTWEYCGWLAWEVTFGTHSALFTQHVVFIPRGKTQKPKPYFWKVFFFFSFYFSYYYIYGFTFVMPWWFSRAFFTFNSCSRIIGFCFFILVGGSMEPKRPTLTRKCKSFQRANPIIFFFSVQLIGRISQNWLICVHKTATQRYLSNTSRFFVHQKIKTVRLHLV